MLPLPTWRVSPAPNRVHCHVPLHTPYAPYAALQPPGRRYPASACYRHGDIRLVDYVPEEDGTVGEVERIMDEVEDEEVVEEPDGSRRLVRCRKYLVKWQVGRGKGGCEGRRASAGLTGLV